MKLPDGQQAMVAESKIVEYLLSTTHPDGQYKAVYFAQFGFNPERWIVLADALRRHAMEHEVTRQEDTALGTWYIVEGELEVPRGTRPWIRSVRTAAPFCLGS